MHSVSDEDCDKLFRDKLYSFETEPSDAVWGSITEQLNSGKEVRSFPILRMAAASMIAMIGFGMWLAATKKPMRLTGTKNTISISPTQETKKVSVQPPNQVVESVSVQIASKVKVVPVSIASTVARKSQIREEKLVTMVDPEQLREKENTKSTIAAIKEQPAVENESLADKQAPSMTLASHSVIELEQNEPPLRPAKIRSVGSLVNFVVSKVDKRKNKIIEFKEGDEGVIVSGIDLGLLKYKSKDK